jgi:hypothetical protein
MRDISQLHPEQKESVEQTQSDIRSQRVEKFCVMVDELFPGEEQKEVRENIKRSFSVPQFGDYHNEGSFMDSHLDLILEQIEKVGNCEFSEELSAFTREALKRAVDRDPMSVRRYVFLHDIAKADCLTVKFGEEAKPVTWDEWQKLLSWSENGRKAQTGDEDALKAFCEEQGITSISYFQETKDVSRKHGEIGANALRTISGMDEVMLGAIAEHEVAYSFEEIKVKTYEDHFGVMPHETRDFVLLASFVDTMASLRNDGKPDLTSFLALAGSHEKYDALVVLEQKLEGGSFDKQKFERAWATLRRSADPVTLEMIGEIEARLRKECKVTGYDVERLRQLSEALVANETLTIQEQDRLLEIAQNEPQAIGRTFGAKMRFLSPILKQCQT